MPMQKCFISQPVFDPHLKPLPQHQGKPPVRRLFTTSKTFTARPLTSIIRESTLSSVGVCARARPAPNGAAQKPCKKTRLDNDKSMSIHQKKPQNHGINTKEHNRLTL